MKEKAYPTCYVEQCVTIPVMLDAALTFIIVRICELTNWAILCSTFKLGACQHMQAGEAPHARALSVDSECYRGLRVAGH